MIKRLLKKYMRNASRVHLLSVNKEFANAIPQGSLLLDAASGIQPYRSLFNHTKYESADFEKVDKKYGETTYVCDLIDLPMESDKYDYILFNQALEHVTDPMKVLQELARVLKPGGRMLISAPFFYEEHEQPYDFYRYTQFAYKHMLPKVGLSIEKIDWLEGYLGTLAYQLEGAALKLPRGIIYTPIRLLFAGLAIWFCRLDIAKPLKSVGYPKNYVVLARKAGS